MKILLLGANGQVGFELARALAPLGELHCATRDGRLGAGVTCLKVDLAQAQQLNAVLQTIAPEIIVNAAAYTAVDRAEDEPALAQLCNAAVLAPLGTWAIQHRALVVHYSTDYVFDGSGKQPYREDDAVAPLGVYGRSKLDGEKALRASSADHLILRTAWVYAARGHNFLRTMLKLGRERGQLRIVNDQRGAPTSARLIAAATAAALAHLFARRAAERAPHLGTYHLSASGACTWFEFAQAIFARASAASLIGRVPELVPIATADYPTKARRPVYSVLDTAKLRSTFGLHLPSWNDGLDAVIAELASLA